MEAAMLKSGTKIVFIRPGVPHRKVGDTGVVIDSIPGVAYFVEWDDGDASVVALDAIEDRHALKRAFKHGPKLKKRDLGAGL